MAEFVEVTRPDGVTVTVSRKAFNLIYRGRGYAEGSRGDAAPLAASDESENDDAESEAEPATGEPEPEPAAGDAAPKPRRRARR